MINDLETYINTAYSNMTYGQIPDTPDNLYNMNIYDTGNNPFFKDGSTHILNINLFIRDASFESMQSNNESIGNWLNGIYDIVIPGYHIVNTKKVSSQEPQRDVKNRYSIYSTYEMLIEEV